jgi:hypothetical protein
VRALATLLVVGALLGACTDGDDDTGPSPDPDVTTPESLTDYRGVVLPGVGGETTTTIDETGSSRLVGTVTGPSGRLVGATVRIDRLVADRVIRRDVVTGADGRWELAGVPGGRYRVRAFQAPRYVQPVAEVRFLTDGDEHSFDLRVEEQGGLVVRADAAPDQPVVDGPVNVVVLVAERTVSPDGIVRSTPLSGVFVELTGLGRWVARGEDDFGAGTDDTTSTTFDDGFSDMGQVLTGDGRARFELVCVSPGDPRLSLRIPVRLAPDPAPADPGSTTSSTAPRQSVEEVPLGLPSCSEAPRSTTTTTSSSSTSTSTSTSTP